MEYDYTETDDIERPDGHDAEVEDELTETKFCVEHFCSQPPCVLCAIEKALRS